MTEKWLKPRASNVLFVPTLLGSGIEMGDSDPCGDRKERIDQRRDPGRREHANLPYSPTSIPKSEHRGNFRVLPQPCTRHNAELPSEEGTKRFKDFCLKAKAILWPRLSCMSHIRSNMVIYQSSAVTGRSASTSDGILAAGSNPTCTWQRI